MAGQGRYPYNRGKHLIAAITLDAYGDESGMEASARYCLLMGYVGNPGVWDSFKTNWQAVIDANGLDEFHSHYFFNNSQSHKNPYRDWSPAKRREFLDSLLEIIASHKIVPIGWAVDIQAFKALRPDEARFVTGAFLHVREGIPMIGQKFNPMGAPSLSRKFKTSGAPSRPYFVVFIRFLKSAWALMPNDSRLNFTFDIQRVVEGMAVQDFYRIRKIWNEQHVDGKKELGPITYADSKHEPPLQAADLYAFAWSQYLHGSASDEVHYALRSLTEKKGIHQIADANFFRETLAELRRGLAEDRILSRDVPTDDLEHKNKDGKS